jgi:hypothetical protein
MELFMEVATVFNIIINIKYIFISRLIKFNYNSKYWILRL